MIIAFSSNLNTGNLHSNIKNRPFYKIMEVFIPKLLILKRSQNLYHVQFLLSVYTDSDLGY